MFFIRDYRFLAQPCDQPLPLPSGGARVRVANCSCSDAVGGVYQHLRAASFRNCYADCHPPFIDCAAPTASDSTCYTLDFPSLAKFLRVPRLCFTSSSILSDSFRFRSGLSLVYHCTGFYFFCPQPLVSRKGLLQKIQI